MVPIIRPDDLVSLYKKENLLIVDVRAGAGAIEKYRAGHLDGAYFADLELDLSEKGADAAIGGRHPLPPVDRFCRFLGQSGIGPDSHVVVYDDKNGALAAARFWWMLRAVGHERVQVLDGGFDAAIAAGFPVNAHPANPVSRPPYPAERWLLPIVPIERIDEIAQNPDFQVIDVREAERYAGLREPIDLIAGHIPGAVNIPFAGNLDSKGFFRAPEDLRAGYSEQTGGRDAAHIVVHCGSGVTACHTLLAMDYAGMEIPALYVGSWSEWSRTEREIATKAD